jgi:hypothetical protein
MAFIKQGVVVLGPQVVLDEALEVLEELDRGAPLLNQALIMASLACDKSRTIGMWWGSVGGRLSTYWMAWALALSVTVL